MHECFLDGVLGKVRVPQGQASDREEAVAGGRRENLEGLVVALRAASTRSRCTVRSVGFGSLWPARHYMTDRSARPFKNRTVVGDVSLDADSRSRAGR